ncbi:hypothetical protein [Haloferula sp. BvORR071]|uniref:hypothetical protein n=1 Tax=Haloferula sp. BvORR071 TaxID=1396141 RepID=UPI00055163DB|nr:hypothetical protein [Haloferula sp. BvORR071]
MKICQIPCAITAMLLAAIPAAKAGGEGGVPFTLTEAKLSTLFAGYSFNLKLDDKGQLQSLAGTYKGKEFKVPKAELPDLKEVDLHGAHLNALGPASAGPLEAIILIIPFSSEFRKDPDYGTEAEKDHDDPSRVSDKVQVTNVIRILFSGGKFARWEKATSLGEDSHAWRLSFKDAGNPEEDNGKHDSLGNPYWTVEASGYWTRR